MAPARSFHLPHGTTAAGDFSLVVTPESAGWTYSGLRIATLRPGGSVRFHTGPEECVVLPLSGSAQVTIDGQRFDLEGRAHVFSRVTDFVYAPRDSEVEIRSERGGRFAVPSARATQKLTPRYGPASGVSVELRGAGNASRQVNNFCTPEAFPHAEKLIAVEVLTPGGNWSSYPPHKHDEHSAHEVPLEEIYYFETENDAMGYQRVYSSGPGKEINVCAEVKTGDVVLIPYGYHGPSMAPPGYHLYYLNVMAGPSAERAWRVCFDPKHDWVRGSWEAQTVDPRLPLTSVREKA